LNELSLSMLLGMLAFLLVLSAFFSGSETAILTLNRYRLKHLVKQKHRGAIKVHELLKKPERLMGLILLGNSVVNILAAAIATLIAIRLGGDQTLIFGTVILIFGILVFAEVTPKMLGSLRPETLAFISAWIYVPLLKIFYPAVWLINGISKTLLWLLGVRTPLVKNDTLSKEELRSIVSDSEYLLPTRYQNMLLSILDLESAKVEDIMTYRKDIVGIDLEDSIENIIEQLQNSRYTRLPVYKKTIDRVIGFLHIRTMLSRMNQPDFDKHAITDNLINLFFIPAGTSIHKQMQIFKAEKLRIGLVVDEYGDVQGLVTLDDLLQEILGELIEEVSEIKKQADGSYIVDASISVRELNRFTHWELPTEGPKTLNGLITEYMETIPAPGTSIKLHGHILEIMQRNENTVKLVRFYGPHTND